MHVHNDEPPPPPDDAYSAAGNITPIRRVPHTDPQAELAILYTALCRPGGYARLADHVNPTDFYDARHEIIWRAATTIAERDGLDPDIITVRQQLDHIGELNKTDTILINLLGSDLPYTNPEQYAQIIRELALKRDARSHIDAVSAAIETSTIDQLPHIIDRSYQAFDHISARLTGNGITTTQSTHTDLTWLLTGQRPEVPPPAYVQRANGHATFYAGRVNGIFGDPETAKSWLAMVGVVETLTNGQRAAYIDVDHNGPAIITERLLLLGAHPHDLADPDRFRYHQPDDGPELITTTRQLTKWEPAYAVLDSIGEMMPMLGVKSVDNDELSGALRTIANPLADTGTCVVTIDHLPKSTEARSSGFAIGGTAKKRAIDGAYIHAEAKTPPAPGHIGKIVLRIEKDRPGRLREHARGKYLGTFTIDSTNALTTISIGDESPITDDGVFRPTGLMEKISRHIEDSDLDPSGAQIERAVRGKGAHIRAAIECLVNEGFLARIQSGRGHAYHSIATYREDTDEQPS